MKKGKAKLLKDNLRDFTGHAAVYELTPPLVEKDYEGNKKKHRYVVVSATVAMFSGPETYIFPSDKNGRVLNYGELDGSYRGGMSHERALLDAGYAIA
jgi:hypothetical protein